MEEDTFEEPLTDRYSIRQTITAILKSPLTLLFLALSFFQEALFAITDVNFLVSMQNKISEDVSIFLSCKRAWIAFSNIIFGLFIYPTMIKHLGIKNSILITPLFLLGIYIFWFHDDNMTAAMFGLIASEGITFICEDNNINLLTKTAPSKIRSKLRIINDSFFEPLGFLISTSILVLLPTDFGIPLGLYVSVIVCVVAIAVRYFYPSAIFMNLKHHIIQFETSLTSLFQTMGKREKKRNISHLLAFLQSGDEDRVLLAIKSLLALHQKRYIPKILAVANGLSASAKRRLITLWDETPYKEEPQWIATLHNWLIIENSIKAPIQLYLARYGLLQHDALKDLEADNLQTRCCAILTLQTCVGAKNAEQAILLTSTAKRELELLLGSDDVEEILTALSIMIKTSNKDSLELALFLLFHNNPAINTAAAQFVSMHIDSSYGYLTEHIINAFKENSNTQFRMHCLNILKHIADPQWIIDIFEISLQCKPIERRYIEKMVEAMGLKTVPFLLQILKDNTKNDKCRILALRVLARLALPQLQAVLKPLYHLEITKAFFYFYYGHVLASHDHILQEVLLTSFYSKIDFLIHLLAVHGEIEEPEVLSLSLRTENPKIKSHAIETLETACDSSILNAILPIIDTRPLENKINHCRKSPFCDTSLSLQDVVLRLENSPSLINKIIASRFKAQYNIAHWRKDLIKNMTDAKEPFHIFAYELLEQYSDG